MDRRAWWATVHGGHRESDMTERLSTHGQKLGMTQAGDGWMWGNGFEGGIEAASPHCGWSTLVGEDEECNTCKHSFPQHS